MLRQGRELNPSTSGRCAHGAAAQRSALRSRVCCRAGAPSSATTALLTNAGARHAHQKLVIYVPNLLSPRDAEAVRKECARLRPTLRPELNCIAQGRVGCYLAPSSLSTQVLKSQEVAHALQERLREPRLVPSDFPIELRVYPPSAHMPWHLDEQLYALPQWECIYTVENSSDSETEWRDSQGQLRGERTEPNSLLMVRAEGWEHRVLPGTRGERSILKFIYTTSTTKLPAYHHNLERAAYEM